ncbi:MAG: TetR/AcrR family transcriptional regulator [Actinomycetota bacterium]|nr:TetR/AcrR family transcriptional regulator [Actinomycetota bacterium]
MTAIERDRLVDGSPEAVPHTSQRIEEAALQLFYERGFKATTMREIALACGVTPGALYNHFTSKDELLGKLLCDIHQRLAQALDEALATADPDPISQMFAYCRAHALFHTTFLTEARVANREIGSLAEEPLADVVAIRRRATEQLRTIVTRGQDEGIFDVHQIEAVCNLILTMAISIAGWYRPGGELDREAMADLDASTALRMVGVGHKRGATR